MATVVDSWINALSLDFDFIQNQTEMENWNIILESSQ